MKKKQYINEERMFRELLSRRVLKENEEYDPQLLSNLLAYCRKTIFDFDTRAQACNNSMGGYTGLYGVEQNDSTLYEEMAEKIEEYLEDAEITGYDAYDLVDDVFFADVPETDESKKVKTLFAQMCSGLDQSTKSFLWNYLNTETDVFSVVGWLMDCLR